jgi:hypothetical protein
MSKQESNVLRVPFLYIFFLPAAIPFSHTSNNRPTKKWSGKKRDEQGGGGSLYKERPYIFELCWMPDVVICSRERESHRGGFIIYGENRHFSLPILRCMLLLL